MNIPKRVRAGENGQAAVLVVLAMAVFLIGGVGLAIDGSHLYAERQMAQAAADAAAQAGIRSVYTGSSASGATSGFSTTGSFRCSTSDPKTPCYYAQTLNGFNGTGDTVDVDFPSAATVGIPSTSLSASAAFPVKLLRVTVKRSVPITLLAFVSSLAPAVTASATGAIVSVQAPVPILVTHPHFSGALSMGGTGSTAKIMIYGGPSRSIQVNSDMADGISWTGNPVVDLSNAGPNGSGADFGDFGGPQASSMPTSITSHLGTGIYVEPAYPIYDPLADVSPPVLPGPLTWPTNKTGSLAAGANGCPSGSGGCTLYYPGYWTTDILVKNQNAVFAPGIYYMYGSSFLMQSNSFVAMATGLTDNNLSTAPTTGTCCGTNTSWGGSGTTVAAMLMYFTGPGSPATTGGVSITSNAGGVVGGVTSFLNGAPNGSSYKGILFFVDRNAAAHTHSINGGATVTMTGTIYTNNSAPTSTQYQTLEFTGNGASSTILTGEIITNVLTLQGTPGIRMNLSSTVTYTVSQLALVQ